MENFDIFFPSYSTCSISDIAPQFMFQFLTTPPWIVYEYNLQLHVDLYHVCILSNFYQCHVSATFVQDVVKYGQVSFISSLYHGESGRIVLTCIPQDLFK